MRSKILIRLSALLFALIIFNNYSSFAENNSNFADKVEISNPKIVNAQAKLFYKSGNYQDALSYLLSLDEKIQDEEILILISNCYESLGDNKKASDYLVKSISQNNKNYKSYYNLALLQYKVKNVEFAIFNLEKAIKYNNKFTEAYYNLGSIYLEQNQPQLAINNYKKALSIDPNNLNAIYNLALAFEKLKNTKNSTKYFDLYKKVGSLSR